MSLSDFQGSYDPNPAPGYAGMIATLNQRDVVSYAVESADTGFGLAMGQGSADRGAVAGGADFVGISVADKSRTGNVYAMGEQAGLMRKGVIWVKAASAVTVADPVTYDANGDIGAGLTTAIENARFESAAALGEFVRVYLG